MELATREIITSWLWTEWITAQLTGSWATKQRASWLQEKAKAKIIVSPLEVAAHVAECII